MPYTISIDSARKRALVVGFGANDFASTIAAMDELAAHPDFEAGFGMLCDFRGNEYTPGTADSGKLADAYASRFAGRPMAAVVSGLLNYGVANMITTIVRLRGSPVAAFQVMDDAEAWLEEAIAKASV
jgi:hypothetical protein